VCPGCRGHLRLDKAGAVVMKPTWLLEGSFTAERPNEQMEYSMVISIRNERNEEIARQVVNVGAVQGMEKRTFTLSIETSEGRK
jgi:hypothetical protein